MITHPTTAELARAVAQWLDELRPQLDQRNGYLVRVAISALGVIDRELSQREAAELELSMRLSKLLDSSGDYDSLTHELCVQLEDGRKDIGSPGLLSILRSDTLAKLAIDQPTYRHENSK